MSKCYCGEKAVYFRKHEGNWYCKRCIARQVEKNFKKEIRKNKLQENTKVFVKPSDDVSSKVLLHLLEKLRKKIRFKLIKKGKYDVCFSSSNLDEECENIIKTWFKNSKKYDKCIKPLKYVPLKEIELYAEYNKIHFKKTKDNDIKKFLDTLESKKPGTKIQIVKFDEKIKN